MSNQISQIISETGDINLVKTTLLEVSKPRKSNFQSTLFPDLLPQLGKHGTFSPNYIESVHRWYPYLEGFSSTFVQRMLDEFGSPNCRVYDPFAGSGTTITVSSYNEMVPFYCEINPFMRLVIEAKSSGVRDGARRKKSLIEYFSTIERQIKSNKPSLREAQQIQKTAFDEREYFVGMRLIDILAIRNTLRTVKAPSDSIKNLALVALGAIAVNCSELIRAGDVRYRRDKEKLPSNLSVLNLFHNKLLEIASDITPDLSNIAPVTRLADSALDEIHQENHIDLVITSPPYLNGTNYCRNTKLELWLTDRIEGENTLSDLRRQSVAAGINNVSALGRLPQHYDDVEIVASKLDKVAYDKRIPELVRRYSSDAGVWLGNISKLLTPQGTAVVDIGDSRFAGVYVPTPKLLASIGEQVGLRCIEQREVRARRSHDGGKLSQVLLIFKSAKKIGRKANGHLYTDEFKKEAVEFGKELPHRNAPYMSRNWGHGLHSLCSYQGKLKPAIAHFLVERFSQPGDTVLDPMSGSGTIPLEAFLQGRKALGNDLQELGYILTRAKVENGTTKDVQEVLNQLAAFIEQNRQKQDIHKYSDFGFNGKLTDYFHPDTYREILAARQFILKYPCDNWAQSLVYSSLLHILHGNRPYALSRRSHPVTPFKPTGNFQYRPLLERLSTKCFRSLALLYPDKALNGSATQLDLLDLPYKESVDVVITSPPFAGSTRFYIANWMRLWMAGWEPKDFNNKREQFLEFKQKLSMDAYEDFFSVCTKWLKPGGRLVMHVGRTAKVDMAQELMKRSGNYFETVYWFNEDVSGREKFGIRDQGATTSHQYVFFRKLGGKS